MAQEQHGGTDETAPACERMPYQETTDPAFGQQAAGTFIASRAADGTTSLVGSCPRCSAGMEVVIPDEMFLANRTGRPSTNARADRRDDFARRER